MKYNGRSYYDVKKMSTVDIINEAYPWEIPLKLAEPLVDRYNLTIVTDRDSFCTRVCAPFGVIFEGLDTVAVASYPHYEIGAYEIEITGVLFFDNSTAELEHLHMFNDLIIPFSLPVWLFCAVTCGSMSVLLKVLYKIETQLALLAAFGCVIGCVVPSLKSKRNGRFYTSWLLGGAFVGNVYVSSLHSNVVVPGETSISKNINDLHASNYTVIGTSLFSVYDIYNQQYQGTLEKLLSKSDANYNAIASVLQNYLKLLDMLDKTAYPYEEQYELIMGTKSALFGEMHNLNVLRYVLPAEQRRKFKFTQESFFPKLKNFVFQLHHAPIIAHGYKRLVSNGIFRYWENIRFLADRLAWWRVLKPILRESWNREKHSSVGLSDTLVSVILCCLLVGLCLGLVTCLVERLFSAVAMMTHKTHIIQLLNE